MNIQFNARAGDDDARLLSLGKSWAEAEERYKLIYNNSPEFESNSEEDKFSRILGEALDLVRKLRKPFYNIQAHTNAGRYLKMHVFSSMFDELDNNNDEIGCFAEPGWEKMMLSVLRDFEAARLNTEPPLKTNVEPRILSFVGEWRAALAEYDEAEALYYGKYDSCPPRFKARFDRANAAIDDLRAKIMYMNAPTAECIFFKAEVAAQYHSGVFKGPCECYDDENQTKDLDNSNIDEVVMLYILDCDFKKLWASLAADGARQVKEGRPKKSKRRIP